MYEGSIVLIVAFFAHILFIDGFIEMVKQMKQFIFAAVTVLMFSMSAQGQVFDKTFDVDISEGVFFDEMIDMYGNPGDTWAIVLPVEAFVIDSGDTILTQINFSEPMMLIQEPGDPYLDGDEIFVVEYRNQFGHILAFMQYSVTLDVIDGIANYSVFESGGVIPGQMLGVTNWGSAEGNLTDSYLVINGLYMELYIEGGYDTITDFTVNFQASDIAFVPEPGTILLVGLGGFLLRRRSKV